MNDGTATAHRRRRSSLHVVVTGVVAVALLSLLAVQLLHGAERSRRGLEERTASRTALAKQFVDEYIADLEIQIRVHAELSLA